MKMNEKIEERMRHRGVNQTMICKECGLVVQNFNAFLRGKRNLAKNDQEKVMNYLGFAYKKDETTFPPTLLEEKIMSILKGGNENMATIAKNTGVSTGTLSTIINGKRQMSTKVLNTLVEYFDIKLVVVKKTSSGIK